MSLRIRAAVAGDLSAINAIYNYYVPISPATFATEPMTAAERASWWARHGDRYPISVAERAGEVLGWASLSPYSDRGGYRFTVESSVYVRADAQRQGIGQSLMREVLARGARAGFHRVLAKIESSQSGSIALHRDLGFREAGRLDEVGHKFGRWLSTVLLLREQAAEDGDRAI